YSLVLGARRIARLEAIARETGGRAIQLDVGDLESVRAFAGQVPAADLLVNNAGMAVGRDPFLDLKPESWDEVVRVNLLGTLYMSHALLPKLIASGGHLVNIGSILGFEVAEGTSDYAAAKHGVRAFSQVLRLELNGTA